MRRSAAALALALLLPLPGLAGEVTVKPGETLSEIAERYGTTVQRLMQLNNLRTPQDLWAGSRIQVPGASGSAGRSGGATGSGNYTVKSGETLSEIAERYGTTVQRLMQLNNLRTPQDLWAGSRIQVPGGSPGRTASSTQSTPPPVNRNAREHTVKSGETLSEIADRYGVSIDRLVTLNNLQKPNDLQIGDTLKLRATPASAAKPPARPRLTTASKPAAAPSKTKPTNKPSSTPTSTAAVTTPKPATVASASPAARPTSTANTSSAAAQASTTAPTATASNGQGGTRAPAQASTAASPPARATTAVPAASATPAPAVATATAAAAKPITAAAQTAPAKPTKPASPDWRSYGPLQVDWANWQPMAGSYVAPTLNSEGQPLYLAVNCSARRLNATGQSGTWKTWDAPQSDFEEQLITDLCKAKGS